MPAATIAPVQRIQGRLSVPGDKSISHRYALVAALAHGRSRFTGFSTGADCRSTLACLRGLGVEVTEDDEATLTLTGRGLAGFYAPVVPLDAGNSGTTMRLLAGVLSGQPFVTTLVGDASLSRRPMGRVMEPLGQMGARIEATDGHAPLTVHGGPLRPSLTNRWFERPGQVGRAPCRLTASVRHRSRAGCHPGHTERACRPSARR